MKFFYKDKLCPVAAGRGAWSNCTVILKDNPGKKFRSHEKSHHKAILMRTEARIDDALSKADNRTREEKPKVARYISQS